MNKRTMQWISLRVTLAFGAILLLIGMVSGQAPSPTMPAESSAVLEDENREMMQRLLKRIEELELQVRELKEAHTKEAVSAPTTPPKPPENAAAAATATALLPKEPAAAPPEKTDPGFEFRGLQIRGFSDVNLSMDPRNGKSRMGIGNLDLLLTSQLSERLSVLGELNLSVDATGAYKIEPERLFLQYNHNDYLNIAVGRYHNAVGYYNLQYHHGKWFETAATRPIAMEFEDRGGFLPLRNIGVSVSGKIPSGKLGLNYVAQLGNGGIPHYHGGELVNGALVIPERKDKSFNVALFSRPQWIPGLQIGASLYRDKHGHDGKPGVWMSVMNGHIVYQRGGFEFLNEAILMRHASETSGREWNAPGFYSQMANQFGKYRPYLRYQYLNVSRRDPWYGELGSFHGPSGGLRLDFSAYAALKFEYELLKKKEQILTSGTTYTYGFPKTRHRITAQLAFTF
ncbi:MAG TPA: hypothetical protein VFZ34_19200 [Blastocatellia bacterium]|nr:hypothetical protein [Blastocatellia bacterium]